MKQQTLLANSQIKSNKVLLIDKNGINLGEKGIGEARREAVELGLDLVQVAYREDLNLPVCKIADYGKMKYEQSRSKKHLKHKSQSSKEIMFHLRTSDHDLGVKKKKVEQLISKSYKVKFGVELRGREKAFRRDAREKLEIQLLDFEKIARHDEIHETDRLVYVTLDPIE